MTIIVISWLIAMLFFLFTSKNNIGRFQVANILSIGTLGLVLGKRLPSEITNREKLGLSIVITVFLLVVLATTAGYIQ